VAVVGIVAAAGGGSRLGSAEPKAFAPCAGRPLLDWSLDVLRAVCDRVVVAVPAGYEDGVDRVPGASSRSASVRAALSAAPEATVAVVHDAARPLVSRALVERCLRVLGEAGCAGVVAAEPMTDTVKQTSPAGTVVRTLPRERLWRVQTPQAFDAAALRRALDADSDTLAAATDDAALVEAAGGVVRVVEAPRENLKVTTAVDLSLAELLLAGRVRESAASA
jgi:2-C-methyl-D-erythritol 4-phosphate cytidylyltransferase